ncbi:helix-turn-helix domain-containing protein [Salmonella enterica subsp. enterica serovar Anatum]|nr:helix-turn-helix domain-containing protein [Salmonella enterica subsp. enterica serovar Anatum]
MLETATFLRNSNFDSISSELIDAAYEYVNAIKKYSHTPTPFPSATHHLDAQAVALDVPSIGTRIRQLRKDRTLTQAELAAAINVTTQAVSLWENDSAVMGVDKLLPLANALKCDPMWLLTGESVPHTEAAPAPVEVMKGVDVSTIGKRIGVARVAKHMNTQELEEAIDAPDGTVFRWETGKAIPSSQYIDCLARILNTSVTWLLTGKEITQEGAARQNGEYAEKQNHHVAQPAGAVSHEALQR